MPDSPSAERCRFDPDCDGVVLGGEIYCPPHVKAVAEGEHPGFTRDDVRHLAESERVAPDVCPTGRSHLWCNDADGCVVAAPARTVEPALDRLDAALEKLTQGKWEVHGHAVTQFTRGTIAVAPTALNGGVFEALDNATGIALIRNMASALSAAVRAAEALRQSMANTLMEYPGEVAEAVVATDVALAAVAAAGEVE